MTLELLESRDVERIAKMLRDYEAGRLFPQNLIQQDPPRAPIESYVGLMVDDIPASDGEPTQGTVAIYSRDYDSGLMDVEPSFTMTAYSLWASDIPQCSWVYLIRDPRGRSDEGGVYFAWPTGTFGCSTSSGSSSGLCCGCDSGCGSGDSSFCVTFGGITTDEMSCAQCEQLNKNITLTWQSDCYWSGQTCDIGCDPTGISPIAVFLTVGQQISSFEVAGYEDEIAAEGFNWVVILAVTEFGRGVAFAYYRMEGLGPDTFGEPNAWDCTTAATFNLIEPSGGGPDSPYANCTSYPSTITITPNACSDDGCGGSGTGTGSGAAQWYCVTPPSAWYCVTPPSE